jgi:peptide/nickel transport system substrate-binding protein
MRPDEESRESNDESVLKAKSVSRRDFLKYAGVAGASVTLGGGLAGLLAACGGTTTTTTAATTATTTAATTATTTAATTATTAAGPTTTAVSTATTGAAAAGGTLKVAIGDLGSELMDPTGAAESEPLYFVYESLVDKDPKGNLIGWLAQDFNMSSDGLLWTFNLRKGVKWHNGDPFTSADVKFSLERFISPDAKNPWSPMQRQSIDHIEIPDDYTVKVFVKTPYVFYAEALTGAQITSKKYFESVDLKTYTSKIIGTGPWKLTNYVAGTKAEFDANADYYGDKAAFAKLEVDMVPEESTRIAMLKNGDLDIINVRFDNANTLKAGGYELRQTHMATTPGLFLPGYWLQTGPTSDVRVREAIDTAINRPEIATSFFQGYAEPGLGVIGMTESAYGFNPIWYSIKYDPDKAKQLLADAGYPSKFSDPTVKVFSTTQGQFVWEPDLMQLIAGYLEAVGIKTQVVPQDQSALRSDWMGKSPNVMGGIVPWVGNSADTTMAAFQNHYTNGSTGAPVGVNHGGNDPALDKLFFQMVGELDATKRLAEWQQVQEMAFNLHGVLGLVRVHDQYVVSKKVGAWNGKDWMQYGFERGLAGVQPA